MVQRKLPQSSVSGGIQSLGVLGSPGAGSWVLDPDSVSVPELSSLLDEDEPVSVSWVLSLLDEDDSVFVVDPSELWSPVVAPLSSEEEGADSWPVVDVEFPDSPELVLDVLDSTGAESSGSHAVLKNVDKSKTTGPPTLLNKAGVHGS